MNTYLQTREFLPHPLNKLALMLISPRHRDKRRMEAAVTSEYNSSNSVIKGYVLVRPSLLTNGKAYGKDYIRVGTEAAPAVGYTISRDDVGLWMFENLIKGDNSKYLGQAPSITY